MNENGRFSRNETVELKPGTAGAAVGRFFERQSLDEFLASLSTLQRLANDCEVQSTIAPPGHDIQQLNDKLVVSNALLAVANADLEAFSYSVAHDLRSPIHQIAGFSRILLEDYGTQLPAEACGHLHRVEQGAQRMGCLVDDLLRLATAGQQALALQVASLDSIVAEALELLQPECSGRRIEWRIDSLCSLRCDPGLMKQVFVNLLANAIKYTRPRDPAVIRVGQTVSNDEQVIFVADNGVGFDMKRVGRLFGVFERLHASSEFEGTGIGLATTERIIRKHHGRIWAEAEPGRGATFSFTLPSGLPASPNPG